MQIQSATLLTSDLPAQYRFYAKQLGFALVAETAETMTFQIGVSLLRFQQDRDFKSFYHFAFDVSHNQIDEAAAWLSQRVPLLETEGQSRFRMVERWNSSNMYFNDPAGNIAEFIARHDQPSSISMAAQSEFRSESVLHISELGVVLPSVSQAVKWLKRQFNLEPFVGQSDTFTAVGGHEGMLILVQEGRHWFPTQREAKAAPFAIQFVQDNQVRQIQHTYFVDRGYEPSAMGYEVS